MVFAVLLVLPVSKLARRLLLTAVGTSLTLLVSCGGSAPVEQAQLVTATPTAVATTPPLTVPTETPVPDPTATALPAFTPTPTPAAAPTPTAEPDTPTPVPDPNPNPTATPAPAEPADDPAPTATPEAAATATPIPTPIPTSTPEQQAADDDTDLGAVPPIAATTPTVVVATGEPPLECYDRAVDLYRGFVEGVDTLSFEGGRVYCNGAGTNAVSAARSYRHATGLIVNRNADYLFNGAGTGYINFSGTMHFCMEGAAASSPFQAATVPQLLLVIDSEALRQVAQGATPPASFNGGGAQC